MDYKLLINREMNKNGNGKYYKIWQMPGNKIRIEWGYTEQTPKTMVGANVQTNTTPEEYIKMKTSKGYVLKESKIFNKSDLKNLIREEILQLNESVSEKEILSANKSWDVIDASIKKIQKQNIREIKFILKDLDRANQKLGNELNKLLNKAKK